MKEWLEYQFKNQVVEFDWDYASRPIDNVYSVIGPVASKLKELYRAGQLNIREGNFFDENYISRLEASDMTNQEIKKMFEDSQYKDLLANSNVDQLIIPDLMQKYLEKNLADKLRLVSNIDMAVHLQKPGQYILWHIDRSKFKEFGHDIDVRKDPPYQKFLIFFDDWTDGQCFQMGKNFIKWKKGDVFTWNQRDVPHGSCNFGFDDRWVLRISGRKAVDL